MSEDEQYVEVPVEVSPIKAPRAPGWLIAVALTSLTGVCIAGLVYAVILDGDPGALTTLGQLGTIGLTGLLTLAGIKNGKD